MQIISLLIFTQLSVQAFGHHFRMPINFYKPKRYMNIQSSTTTQLMLPFPVQEETPKYMELRQNQEGRSDFYNKLFPSLRVDNRMTERNFIKHLEDLVDFITVYTNINVEIFDPTIL